MKEMGFGICEGMKHGEVKESYPEQQLNFWNKPNQFYGNSGN